MVKYPSLRRSTYQPTAHGLRVPDVVVAGFHRPHNVVPSLVVVVAAVAAVVVATVPPASVVHVVAAVAAGGGGTTRHPLQDFVVIDPPGIANQRKTIRHGVLFRLRQWQAQLLAAVSELHPVHLWMEIQKKKEKGKHRSICETEQMYRRNTMLLCASPTTLLLPRKHSRVIAPLQHARERTA